MIEGKKLNIGRLSLWIENSVPRFAGTDTLVAAQGQAREIIREIEDWLNAEDHRRQSGPTQLPLSGRQQRAVKKLEKYRNFPRELAEEIIRELDDGGGL